tara:strand:- start:3070 stop:3381 length:312 start_codon:yes stop_codon:yes gene_type:complete
MEKVLTVLGGLVFTILAVFYLIVSVAFVQVYYWDWFIIPLGLDLPTFTISQWVSINLMMSLIKPNFDGATREKTTAESKKYLITITVFPIMALLFGWIISSCI